MFGGDFNNGIWIAFIGWFLESAAMSQLQQQYLEDNLTGHTVFEAMTRDFAIVPDDTTIQEVMENHILGIGRRTLFVKKDEMIIGLLTLHKIKNVQQEMWPTTLVTEIKIPEPEAEMVDVNFPLWEALKKMDKSGVNQLPVLEDGRIIGVLNRESIITYIRNANEFISRGLFARKMK